MHSAMINCTQIGTFHIIHYWIQPASIEKLVEVCLNQAIELQGLFGLRFRHPPGCGLVEDIFADQNVECRIVRLRLQVAGKHKRDWHLPGLSHFRDLLGLLGVLLDKKRGLFHKVKRLSLAHVVHKFSVIQLHVGNYKSLGRFLVLKQAEKPLVGLLEVIYVARILVLYLVEINVLLVDQFPVLLAVSHDQVKVPQSLGLVFLLHLFGWRLDHAISERFELLKEIILFFAVVSDFLQTDKVTLRLLNFSKHPTSAVAGVSARVILRKMFSL